ncbi:SRPBCC family protein [Kribbella sp. CA-293567]|uniref:SRPBCC family protein n=1 Tax=Kribbella sp. CA-293567 TaxID=3002436 RepID=UPI0022DE6554|nr:SRPBCC domain-containing protein [Kribbella sp. CA-293567]WBQ02923.1 SRPBCC domain-containing protein [Kribbella sp. CA-293567]
MTVERRIEVEVPLDATPEQVWDAIATEAGLTAWLFPMDPSPSAAGPGPDSGVLRWEPGHGFAVRTETGAFEYLIEARDGGSSVLRFVQSGFEGDDWEAEYEATARGWDLYFHTLQLYLSGFPGEAATYVVAEGPAWSGTPEAWSKLRAAIGGEVGDKVELDVHGLGTVVGEVDYAGPSHLGISTDHALLRFHDRSLLGMPVALGHHYYGPGQDAERLEEAWQSWLAEFYLTAQ